MQKPLIAGVVGHPIKHSLSPAIFDWIGKSLKTSVSYWKKDVCPSEFNQWIETMRKISDLEGWNVTLPFKESMAQKVDFLSPECQVLQACNVVKVIEGQLYGYNTDICGVSETLREQEFNIHGCRALIYGAGGAALSVAYALGKNHAKEVWIANRNVANAEKIVTRLGSLFKTEYLTLPGVKNFSLNGKSIFEIEEEMPNLNRSFDLYVNATPVGMEGIATPQGEWLRMSPKALAFDLIYRPEKTSFLAQANHQGLKTVGGLDMLIWQAIGTWELWTDQELQKRHELKASLKIHLKRLLNE